MAIDPQWVSAIADVCVAASIVFVAIQAKASIASTAAARQQAVAATEALKEMQKQAAAEHERARRETAAELLRNWHDRLTLGQPSARFVVETFSIDQCIDMQKSRSVKVPAIHFHGLRNAFKGATGLEIPDDCEGKEITLSPDQVFNLGSMCHNYLNSLEVMLIAWHNHTADRETMEQQLKFLVKPELGYYLLKNFRDAMGGVNAYPNTHAFVERIIQMKTEVPASKAPAYG